MKKLFDDINKLVVEINKIDIKEIKENINDFLYYNNIDINQFNFIQLVENENILLLYR